MSDYAASPQEKKRSMLFDSESTEIRPWGITNHSQVPTLWQSPVPFYKQENTKETVLYYSTISQLFITVRTRRLLPTWFRAYRQKKEAEQEKNGWLFRLFPIYNCKRIYFVAFVGFSNVWKQGYAPYKYIKRSLEDAFVMRAYEPTKYRRCCPYQRGVSKQNETNRFQWFCFFNKCQYIIVFLLAVLLLLSKWKKYPKQSRI
jgi:hypothetical protein